MQINLKCMVIYILGNQFANKLWERNNIIFSGGTIDNIEMFIVVQLKTWGWISTKFPKTQFSYSIGVLILYHA